MQIEIKINKMLQTLCFNLSARESSKKRTNYIEVTLNFVRTNIFYITIFTDLIFYQLSFDNSAKNFSWSCCISRKFAFWCSLSPIFIKKNFKKLFLQIVPKLISYSDYYFYWQNSFLRSCWFIQNIRISFANWSGI